MWPMVLYVAFSKGFGPELRLLDLDLSTDLAWA